MVGTTEKINFPCFNWTAPFFGGGKGIRIVLRRPYKYWGRAFDYADGLPCNQANIPSCQGNRGSLDRTDV